MNDLAAPAPNDDESRLSRSHPVFGSPEFLRLWIAQIVSAFGDWIGFLAIIEIARRIGGDQPGSAIALVMLARVLPGFFLASVGGIIVDRVNRKRLLIGCDILRAGVLLTLGTRERSHCSEPGTKRTVNSGKLVISYSGVWHFSFGRGSLHRPCQVR